MLRNKISILLSVFIIAVIISSCGEKKDSDTSAKTDDKKTKTENTESKTQTTQTQTEKKDSAMTDNQTEAKEDSKKSDGNIVNMETTMGNIKIKLFTKEAPITTANFKKLVNEGFYNGLIFHRVIDGFMIQGGDPTGTGIRRFEGNYSG